MDLSKFKCLCCGKCCRIEGVVRLSPGDITAIATDMGLDEQSFIDLHTEVAYDRRGLVLKDLSEWRLPDRSRRKHWRSLSQNHGYFRATKRLRLRYRETTP